MDLIDRLKEISIRIDSKKDSLTTEEATKNALVMPFINALGYNVFNPTEVIPEFTADVGTKKGEKVDYAIMRDGKPIMLFECKRAGSNLDDDHTSQLYRYFSVTPARFGVLTNGVEYRFFSDLEAPNKMDSRPFFIVNLEHVDDLQVAELKRFAKQTFDLEKILSTASELKYTRGIKRLFGEEWLNPSEVIVRHFAKKVFSGHLTKSVKAQFTTIVKRAFHDFVNDRLNERLQSALSQADSSEDESPTATVDTTEMSTKPGIVTTEEEVEGYYIVKAIVGQCIPVNRVYIRDTISYCGIILDDTNRKPICRLYFNGKQKYLCLFDQDKKRHKYPIKDVNDIYAYADDLRRTVLHYDGKQVEKTT